MADEAEGTPVIDPLTLPKPVLFPEAGAKVAATNVVAEPAPEPLTIKFKVGAVYPPIYPTFTIVTVVHIHGWWRERWRWWYNLLHIRPST